MRADETIRALDLLSNLPAYYRDHVPQEVIGLRREVQKRLASASFYATSADYELSAPAENYIGLQQTLRGQLIIQEIKLLNDKGYIPHIIDHGPGEYWLPRLLKHFQRLFTYEPIYVNHPSFVHYKQYFEKELVQIRKEKEAKTPDDLQRPVIFFAGEIIEHLWREDEIRWEMERSVGLADIVHISTPTYTFDWPCTDWKVKKDLGHLRAYTPSEFDSTIKKMFPEYEVTSLMTAILHARCILKSSSFPTITRSKIHAGQEGVQIKEA